MGLLLQYDPPAYLPEFGAIPGQREAWHEYLRSMFIAVADKALGNLLDLDTGSPAFYAASQLDPGPVVERDLVWNAFPNELLRKFGRERAMREADTRWPLSSFSLNWRTEPELPVPAGDMVPGDLALRPLTEYCEWHIDRCATTGRIQRVTFTCEAPEYWQAMFGGVDPSSTVIWPGDRHRVLDLYRTLVHPDVELEDLLVQTPFDSPLGKLDRGDYNPYNRWNIERGIVHLTAPPNTLTAEVLIAAQATACFKDDSGVAVLRAEAIVAGANIGSANRHSDVAIVGCVNALARQGRRLTLANPVGIYMDHIDLAGWETPDRIPPEDCVRVTRGGGRCMSRLVVEVPSPKFNLGDVRIAGVPLIHGGQIAECITLRLRVAASVATDLPLVFQPLTTSGYVDPSGGSWVFQSLPDDFPPGLVPAFGPLPDAAALAPQPSSARGRATRAVQ